MPEKLMETGAKLTIRVAAAGVGTVLAGPLGGALGAAFGHVLTGPLGDLIHEQVSKFGEKATEKLFDASGDAVAERIRGAEGDLEAAYREALRLGLSEAKKLAGDAYGDWFKHWERCLASGEVLRLETIRTSALDSAALNRVLSTTMIRLDAQGKMLVSASTSVVMVERVMPPELDALLHDTLPEAFDRNINALLVSEKYAVAWKQFVAGTITNIDKKADTLVSGQALTNEKLDHLLALTVRRAEEDQRIDRAEARALRAEGEADDWKKRYLDLARTDPSLDDLLSTGDLDAAVRAKEEQKLREKHKAADASFELGKIHELRFDWPRALNAYREAWELEPNFDHGFGCAYFAQKQNRHGIAIQVYESIRTLTASDSSMALTLNNLAVLYRATQRMGEAEQAYDESLSIRRALAQANPEAYMPDVAMTLNNLAILYRATQRMGEAEQAYDEALSIYRMLAKANPEAYLPYVATALNNLGLVHRDMQRTSEALRSCDEAESILRVLAKANPQAYLPDVALTLNNLAILYSATQRMGEAERAYDEALSIRRVLAKANPQAYLPDVAMTLNNLAVLYRATQRMGEAERACDESLSTHRKLAKANPEAYLPDVALTLNNLAILYSDTQRMGEAERAYDEALSIYRMLAKANPEAYMPDVARTLNNLAVLYRATQRMSEAERAYDEALSIRRVLAKTNPQAYPPDVAMTLNNLAVLYSATQRMGEAERAYDEALSIRRVLAKANPQAYLPDVAMTLNNLAILYRATQRMGEAEQAYDEALSIYRMLAKANPEAYMPDVARTLNNLAILYRDTQRMSEAERACDEAESILRPLWQLNSAVHGNQMGKILWIKAELKGEAGDVRRACELAREALAMVYDAGTKAVIEDAIARWCGDSEA